MSAEEVPIHSQPLRISPAWLAASGFLILVGIVAFIVGLLCGSDRPRIWHAYLFNYFYWTNLSFGGAVFVAAINISNARWGRPFKRLAEGLAAFLPVSFVLFWVIYFGRAEIFEWVNHPLPEKRAWLNVPFFFARDGAAHLVFSALSVAMVYSSVRADRDQPRSSGTITCNGSAWRTQKILSPMVGIAYGFVASLLAIDLLMSLDQHWYSTMFPGYVFAGGFYAALASLYLLAMLLGRRPGALDNFPRPRQFHDLGKLIMAFSIFTGYLYYSQFLVIWYGNLPEETEYLILRTKLEPWARLSWAVLAMIFFVPLFMLLSRRIKLMRTPMILLTATILVGMWLERFLLVAPSTRHVDAIPFGLPEISLGLGFLGLISMCLFVFLKRVPLLPVSDPLFQELLRKHETVLEP